MRPVRKVLIVGGSGFVGRSLMGQITAGARDQQQLLSGLRRAVTAFSPRTGRSVQGSGLRPVAPCIANAITEMPDGISP